MALYLARYLNVPPARIPGEDGERLDDLPADEQMIRGRTPGVRRVESIWLLTSVPPIMPSDACCAPSIAVAVVPKAALGLATHAEMISVCPQKSAT
jgi:hypothetical protein